MYGHISLGVQSRSIRISSQSVDEDDAVKPFDARSDVYHIECENENRSGVTDSTILKRSAGSKKTCNPRCEPEGVCSLA
jgi:hypothetical protein